MEFVPSADAVPRAGQFLLSEPFMSDVWFGRKVVFLCDHDSDGTLGFVIDNFTSRPLQAVLGDAEGWPLAQKLSMGGPVHDDSLFYLHRMGEVVTGGMPVLPGLWLGGDFDEMKAALSSGRFSDRDVRFFAGYSGWTKGQLDHEVRQHSWYVHDAPLEHKMDAIFNPPEGGLWRQMLASKGPGFARATRLPVDPSLN
jgi:putative transcriptional regulator